MVSADASVPGCGNLARKPKEDSTLTLVPLFVGEGDEFTPKKIERWRKLSPKEWRKRVGSPNRLDRFIDHLKEFLPEGMRREILKGEAPEMLYQHLNKFPKQVRLLAILDDESLHAIHECL